MSKIYPLLSWWLSAWTLEWPTGASGCARVLGALCVLPPMNWMLLKEPFQRISMELVSRQW